MTRIPLIDENDASVPAPVREAMTSIGSARGGLVNLYRALANRPEAMTALATLMQTVYRKGSTLEPRHGELAYFTASAVNECFY